MIEDFITLEEETNNINIIEDIKDITKNGKESNIENDDKSIDREKLPDKSKHIIVINPHLKLIEIKPTAATFLFRLINENRYMMNEQIPYFQRIHGINDVVDFIKLNEVKVVETDYLDVMLNSANPYKVKNTSNNKNNKENKNTVERCFLYFINYEKVPIGVIGIYNVDWYNRIGELHFWIAVRFQKKGFMNEVLPKMLDFIFYNIRLNRIIVKVRPNNNPGKMILKKYGFMLEGIERQSFYYIPDETTKDGGENKTKPQSIRHRRRSRSGKGNENGLYYDLCVYSLISRDYI